MQHQNQIANKCELTFLSLFIHGAKLTANRSNNVLFCQRFNINFWRLRKLNIEIERYYLNTPGLMRSRFIVMF